MPTRSAKSVVEIAAGQNAIKHWILTKGWQQALYMHEPGRGPAGGLLNFWCSAMERIALATVSTGSLFLAPLASRERARRRRPPVDVPVIPFRGFGTSRNKGSASAGAPSDEAETSTSDVEDEDDGAVEDTEDVEDEA
ncbi:hypothetical protein N7465_002926 [Penicillium sp. CMV-2018d]|nr:hypothetical protein N7465_002926 [Penicillium sp. CMV-2018d]